MTQDAEEPEPISPKLPSTVILGAQRIQDTATSLETTQAIAWLQHYFAPLSDARSQEYATALDTISVFFNALNNDLKARKDRSRNIVDKDLLVMTSRAAFPDQAFGLLEEAREHLCSQLRLHHPHLSLPNPRLYNVDAPVSQDLEGKLEADHIPTLSAIGDLTTVINAIQQNLIPRYSGKEEGVSV